MKKFLLKGDKPHHSVIIQAESKEEALKIAERDGRVGYAIVWESGPNTLTLKEKHNGNP